MDQPDLGMPSRAYYLKSRTDTILRGYETFAVKMATLLGAEPAAAARELAEAIDFEIAIANVSLSSVF